MLLIYKMNVGVIFLLILKECIFSTSGEIKLWQIDDAIQDNPFSLRCNTGALRKTVYFYNPDSTIAGSCLFPSLKCGSGFGYAVYHNKNTLQTTMTIPNANRSLHEGLWKCSHDSNVGEVTVMILTIPSQVILTGLSSDKDVKDKKHFELLVSCSCDCTYPSVTFGWKILDTETSAVVHSTNVTGERATSKKCKSSVEQAYRTSLLMKKEFASISRQTVKLECTVYLQNMLFTRPKTVISKGRITFSGEDVEPKAQEGKLSGGATAGIVIGVLVFVALVIIGICLWLKGKNSNPNFSNLQPGDKVTYAYQDKNKRVAYNIEKGEKSPRVNLRLPSSQPTRSITY